MPNATITITYGEAVENHVGNQQIGDRNDGGISYSKLKKIEKTLSNKGYNCQFTDLKNLLDSSKKKDADDAGILVVKDFIGTFFKNQSKSGQMFKDLIKLDWDKKALMKGRVVNKKARYNLCFADFAQKPDYAAGKGRVYDFKKLDDLQKIRTFIEKLLNVDLNAEGNYYYDVNQCYIGFHGDTERFVVAGVRFGAEFPLYYRWYQKSEPVTVPHKIKLEDGDLYIMSEKAVGTDWKKRNTLTLRHAAGFNIP
jgi:hypothetical protein